MVALRLDLGLEARTDADRPLVEELLHLRAERNRLYRRWETGEQTGQRGKTGVPITGRSQVELEVLALEEKITGLWHKLLIRNADYARDAALWSIRTEPVQPYLDDQTVLLEYFIAHGRIIAFLVTSSGVKAKRMDASESQIQRFMQLLWLNLKAVPRSNQDRLTSLTANARGILKQLHTLLLEPLLETLDLYHEIVIVPHGLLHYLPFHALFDGDAYVLETHEISYLPGSSLLRFCREARPAGNGLLSVGHTCDNRLPNAVTEATNIASLMNGRPLLESEATLAAVHKAVLNKRVVHLATHGDFRPDNPLFSGLSLEDGWLTTLDIFNLPLKASLITLSACQTGRSVVGGGDELLGLTRAILGAGAASLVASLWAVEDISTAQLMNTFYTSLSQGINKGQALRDAQLLLIQDEQYSQHYGHPYFWAPFILVGDSGAI
jgi:CHAT domain-containing protein